MFHKNKPVILMLLLLIITLFVMAACDTTKNSTPQPEMEGTWIGLGRVMISNEYLNQREIPFMLIIENDGNITGYVGDASIKKTKLQKPVWWLSLVGKKKHSAKFALSGYIVTRESFRREGGTLMIDAIDNGEMLCTFSTTGNQTSSNNLALHVKDIVLRRTQP